MGTDPGTRILASAFPEGGPDAAFPDLGGEKVITVVGLGPRFIAGLIDTVLVAILSLIGAMAVGVVCGLFGLFSPNATSWGTIFTFIGGLVYSLVYYIVAWSKGGQTLGATLLKLKVVTAQGSVPSAGQAIMRYVGFLVSALALSLGFIWIAVDSKRQGWHDKIARTYVIPANESFTSNHQVVFTPQDGGARPIWVGAWIVLVFLAPSVLTASVWALGPFVEAVVRSLRGG